MEPYDVAQLDPAFAFPAADPRDVRIRAFWTAMVLLAILDYWNARPGSAHFRSALQWIFYSGESAPGAFDNVVRLLGFDPPRLKGAIQRRRGEFENDPAGRRRMLALFARPGELVRPTPAASDDDDDDGGGDER